MSYFDSLITNIELHSVEGIKECFANGVNPNDTYNGVPLIYELTSEYTRTPRFRECVKTFVEYGLRFNDQVLLNVLLDDAAALDALLRADSAAINIKYNLRCAYTPLYEASLMHICAEFNHVACAEVLLRWGADINSAAGVDEHGFGGHTPIFHTVNQNSNNSKEMMKFLLLNGADLKIKVAGLVWGDTYPWETFIPSVDPVSYAFMGLIPQMHRDEQTISNVVSTLMEHSYGIKYTPANVPNKYLR